MVVVSFALTTLDSATRLLRFNIEEVGASFRVPGFSNRYVSSLLAPRLLPAIAVTAYSYMSLVPIIQPPLMRLFTTRAERRIRMEYAPRPVPHAAVIAFPIIVTVAVGVLVPASAPLVATLMFGSLLKESGVVPQLANTASNELANLSTIFLGLTVGSLMQADTFLQVDTLLILLLGLVAFAFDTVAGILFGKGLAAVTRGKINPLVGAAGISAFPMSGRLVQKVAQEEDFTNHVLMHAMGANTAGQLGSVIAGGVLLTLVTLLGTG